MYNQQKIITKNNNNKIKIKNYLINLIALEKDNRSPIDQKKKNIYVLIYL